MVEGKKASRIRIMDATWMYSTDPERRGKMDLTVSYTVDEVRFYVASLPREKVLTPQGEIDVEAVKSQIRAIEAERSKVIGLEFEL